MEPNWMGLLAAFEFIVIVILFAGLCGACHDADDLKDEKERLEGELKIARAAFAHEVAIATKRFKELDQREAAASRRANTLETVLRDEIEALQVALGDVPDA